MAPYKGRAMRLVLKASMKEVFSLVDGRLSTNVDDVRAMLSFIFNRNLHTYQLPEAQEALEIANPYWFQDATAALDSIKVSFSTNDFKLLMKIIDEHYDNIEIDIDQLD